MSIGTLEDLSLEQIKDIHSANTQALDITKEKAKATTDEGLTDALNAGADGIQSGIDALEAVETRNEESATGEHCKGMEGLVKAARAHAIEEKSGEDATKDGMIITLYQRLVHYAIAGY